MTVLVVLAGGLGSRLRDVVPDVPKPMAPVNGEPFLSLLAEQWLTEVDHFDRLVISVGYKGHLIKEFFGTSFLGVPVDYVEERVQRGTGGALIDVCKTIVGESSYVINGDTWFVPSQIVELSGDSKRPEFAMLLKFSRDVKRFGCVRRLNDGRVTNISKGLSGEGWINGGVYILNKSFVDYVACNESSELPQSLEEQLIPKWIMNDSIRVYGIENKTPFLDIGIPSDYLKADAFISALKSFKDIQ